MTKIERDSWSAMHRAFQSCSQSYCDIALSIDDEGDDRVTNLKCCACGRHWRAVHRRGTEMYTFQEVEL